jgi:Asp-tRNA(Asn)/Glu-tRNA(Gln) amidotransferase A subunit family amidase
LCWSLDKVGPICRHAEDTAAVLAALNGVDPADAGSLAHGFTYEGSASLEGLRIGYDPAAWSADIVTASDRAAFDVLRRAGATLQERALPSLFWDAIEPVLEAEAAAAFEQLTLSGEDDVLRRQIEHAWPNSFRSAHFLGAVDFVQCQRIRRQLMQSLHEYFEEVDAFVAPSDDEITALTNLTGHPALTLPVGFEPMQSRAITGVTEADTAGPTHPVPKAMHLWSGLFREGTLISIAHAIEQALAPQVGWDVKRPVLD